MDLSKWPKSGLRDGSTKRASHRGLVAGFKLLVEMRKREGRASLRLCPSVPGPVAVVYCFGCDGGP